MKGITSLRKLFLFLLICGVTSHAFGSESDGKITGKIQDRQSGQPIEYATVSVYNSNDSSLVTGIISNKDGVFSIGGLDKGSYYAVVRYIGYANEITSLTFLIKHCGLRTTDYSFTPLRMD